MKLRRALNVIEFLVTMNRREMNSTVAISMPISLVLRFSFQSWWGFFLDNEIPISLTY